MFLALVSLAVNLSACNRVRYSICWMIHRFYNNNPSVSGGVVVINSISMMLVQCESLFTLHLLSIY